METIGKRAARTPAAEVLATWGPYRQSGDLAVRDRLVFMFLPMVRYIVYRKVREVPAQCDVEDFLSCGLEALIRSIERYDPEKGATLEQFAWTRIHGAVVDSSAATIGRRARCAATSGRSTAPAKASSPSTNASRRGRSSQSVSG